jgi:hypothetical protein
MKQGLQIVVKCPDCGELRVSPREVTVRNCVDNGTWSYRFTCPSCHGRTVGKSVEIALLNAVGAGANLEEWTLPTELLERPDGAPFTLVDVLELHLAMLEPDWFDEISCCDLDAQR